MKTYYKVVRSSYRSKYNESSFAPHEVTYVAGKQTKVKIKGTKLFVFGRLKDATDYLEGSINTFKIYTCKATGAVKLRHRLNYPVRDVDMLKLWFKQPRNRSVSSYGKPCGNSLIYGVDSVTLLERIK